MDGEQKRTMIFVCGKDCSDANPIKKKDLVKMSC